MFKKVILLKMSNFTFFHNVFYAICTLKSFNSHISVVVCSFFEFRTSQNEVLIAGRVNRIFIVYTCILWFIGLWNKKILRECDVLLCMTVSHRCINPLEQALVFTCLWYESFENTVGKGEIAHNEQFLIYPQCFLRAYRTLCNFIKFCKRLECVSSTYHAFAEFSTLSFDDVTADDITVAKDMLTKRMATGHRFSTLQNFIIDKPIR